MFRGGVLDEEGEGAGGDGGGGGSEGAEVHEDGGAAVVGDHDVACACSWLVLLQRWIRWVEIG